MTYLEQAPSPILRSWVRSLWYCRAPELPHQRERVLPNGSIQMIVSLSRDHLTDCSNDGTSSQPMAQAVIAGMRSRYNVVDTADMEEIAGVVFRAGGFAGLFRERADLLFERSVALDDLRPSRELVERLADAPEPRAKLAALDAFLQRLIAPVSKKSMVVEQAVRLFRMRNVGVAECARSIGVSERRLSQIFREEIGVAPKMWRRLRRFQTATQALYRKVDIPWAVLALDCGYYDQSHFANDFRAFSGIDPTTYAASSSAWQNHVVLP